MSSVSAPHSVCLSSGSICALSTVEVGHFCRFGAENGQIWPLETGYGRNPPANRCSVFTGDYGRDVWPLADPLTPYLRYPMSAPVIRRFVWGNALRGGQSRGGASNGKTKTMRRRSSPSPTRWAKGQGPIRYGYQMAAEERQNGFQLVRLYR